MTTPIDRLIDGVLEPVPGASPNEDGLPYATHQGILDLMDLRLRVYRLNTGERIVHADDIKPLLAPLLED